jgi:arsenate reductase (thioredoxin)
MQSNRIYNVLFLCTGNSARSILAEALLNNSKTQYCRAYSAGSFPRGAVAPGAIQALSEVGIHPEGLRSKSWDEFAQSNAPVMDFVFTVCDRAAQEICPTWPGQPISAHWGIEDPVNEAFTPEQSTKKFRDVTVSLKRRIDLLLSLPLDKLDRLSLQHQVNQIGKA